MCKKVFTIFLTICFVCMTVNVSANEVEDVENLEGVVTSVNVGEEAPYSGILLDPIAGAKFIAKSKFCGAEIELKLQKEFQTKLVNKQLRVDLLQTQLDSLQKRHDQLMIQKEKEIVQLNEIIKEEVKDHTHWWFAGGVLAGVLLSIGIFYAAVEVQK